MALVWRWAAPGLRCWKTISRRMDRLRFRKRSGLTWAAWKRSVDSRQTAVGGSRKQNQEKRSSGFAAFRAECLWLSDQHVRFFGGYASDIGVAFVINPMPERQSLSARKAAEPPGFT